ncbi:MAG: DUF5343 domain-containing protein [Candidatus Aquilonibacter sp.]
MSLPSSYLTSTKNLSGILAAIQGAKAPERFTQTFLESLDYKSSSDRLVIGLLKALGLLDETGKPTQSYYSFLDEDQAKYVLADAIRSAYADLFAVNVNANQMSKQEVINKLKTLTQGQYSESVIDKMAMTFAALVRLADFSKKPVEIKHPEVTQSAGAGGESGKTTVDHLKNTGGSEERRGVDLVYNIQIHLPESRDPAVYDALFRALKEHIL